MKRDQKSDPLAEARIYRDYGQVAQAESVLKEALQEDPHRTDLHNALEEVRGKARTKKRMRHNAQLVIFSLLVAGAALIFLGGYFPLLRWIGALMDAASAILFLRCVLRRSKTC